MAFLKQQGNTPTDGRSQLYWHRAGDDRAPFRGNTLPMLREQEYEDKVERVWDCYYGTFDTSQPDFAINGRTLQWIMEASMSGWVKVIFREHRWAEIDGRPVMFQYIEWGEPYQELPKSYGSELT